MKIKALKPLRVMSGLIKPGTVVDLPDKQAEFFLRRGEAEICLETRPPLDAGIPSSASPVVQVSQAQTSPPLKHGARKRGRPRKEA